MSILRKAVQLRADLNLKTPDAIHAATATISGCDYLLTNDDGLRRLTQLKVTVLFDLI